MDSLEKFSIQQRVLELGEQIHYGRLKIPIVKLSNDRSWQLNFLKELQSDRRLFFEELFAKNDNKKLYWIFFAPDLYEEILVETDNLFDINLDDSLDVSDVLQTFPAAKLCCERINAKKERQQANINSVKNDLNDEVKEEKEQDSDNDEYLVDAIDSFLHAKHVMQLKLKLKNDVIVDHDLKIGLNYRAVEEHVLKSSYLKNLLVLEKTSGLSGKTLAAIYASMVEDFLKLPITDRTKAIRMAFMELERIQGNIKAIGALAHFFKLHDIFWKCENIVFRIMDILLSYTNGANRMSVMRIGGLSNDLRPNFSSKIFYDLTFFREEILAIEKLLVRNPYWPTVSTNSIIDARSATKWGITGPLLRATGVNYDVRKNNPYYLYQSVDFKIPLGIEGSIYDIFLVRVREIHESISIVWQLFDNLPLGDVDYLKACRDIVSRVDETRAETEHDWNIDSHSLYFHRGLTVEDNLEHYAKMESFNGKLGIYLKTKKSEVACCQIRSPNFYLMQFFRENLKGKSIDEIKLLYSVLGICPYEMDR